MASRLFTRNKEDFTCEVCETFVEGNGYTNHCPHCLHSKHVDINPGDRASSCGGILEPIRIEKKGDSFIIVFKCRKCGEIKKNKTSPQDDFNKILEICRKTEIPL
ncbi:MAG: RNHCP domain-containing protein [Alphaproteobacteria bacterium]|nr:RNHCP domain-containing protein [Alphaproteobacteria bacterium]